MRHLPTLLITLALSLLPLAATIEHNFPTDWQSRLYLPEFIAQPDYHTPRFSTGTYLPQAIRENMTLTANHNPYLLTSTTRINPSITVTIEPGVTIFAAENTALIVDGHLIARGTSALPVTFQSNEKHPLNQTWLGLMAQPQASIDLQHVSIDNASPAISCLPNSHVAISQTKIYRGSVGLFQSQTPCRLTDSFINGPTIGLISINTVPQVINSLIIAQQAEVTTSSTPTN
jgi:hypothetical protein